MITFRNATLGLFIAIAVFAAMACTPQSGTTPNGNPNGNLATQTASPSPAAAAISKTVPVTLPVLDALFADEAFRTTLKTKVELSDAQLAQLRKIASDEVAKLRQLDTEAANANSEVNSQAELSRERAAEAIRGVVGQQKAEQLFALARDYWSVGDQALHTAGRPGATPETLPTVPNSVPKDTRVVVNIPAFRMDVFKNGSLVKSYKIGIGYPEFPLPTGVRKAETIIFNPTWTPPDEPWVKGMKNVSAGEKIPAGSKLNPLGPIKIPIGAPSLIHGGKSLAKIGTFASHGCVGLTTPQVRDFAKVLADASQTDLSDQKIQAYLKNPTRTQALKLSQVIPVELRYETIVIEDGKLHIYRDVYAQDTNTEENLRAVLKANGTSLEDLSEAERTQALDAVNAMSLHPKKAPPKPIATPTPDPADKTAKKPPTPKSAKPIKNQKEIVVELAELSGKGYPAAVELDNGTGKPAKPAATPAEVAGR